MPRTVHFVSVVLLLAGASLGLGQSNDEDQWKSTEGVPPNDATTLFRKSSELRDESEAPRTFERTAARTAITRVSHGNGTLPNKHGQVWREYDITPYTLRVTETKRPEQALIDWILRETGFQTWHSEVTSVLSADERRLRVYHTPEVQKQVSALVDRFVSEKNANQAFSVRIVTVGSPNWRVRAHSLLRPVSVETPGVQAWLMRREDVALLLADLRNRADFRELTSPNVLVGNGQSFMHVATRPRNFNQGVVLQQGAVMGLAPQLGQVEEGFTFEFSPLMGLDGSTIDCVLKCKISQLEKLHAVSVDTPTRLATRQRTRIEIPQVAQFRLSERFRWPSDHVLLITQCMVPNPLPGEQNPLAFLGIATDRTEFMVFVEGKGALSPELKEGKAVGTASRNYHGRY